MVEVDLAELATAEDWMSLLTRTEQRLLAAAARGESLDLRTGNASLDAPSSARDWDMTRVVRGRVLEVLLLEERADWILHHRGVEIIGARIDGGIDLEFGAIAAPFTLEKCFIDGSVSMASAEIKGLAMPGTRLTRLVADGIRVAGRVDLTDGFSATAGVRLTDARIARQLDCRGGSFSSHGGYAIAADGIHVTGRVFFGVQFAANGGVRLVGARIGGQLNCRGGTFSNRDGDADALNLSGVEIAGRVLLGDGFASHGAVRLTGSRIRGQLDCRGGSFFNPTGDALSADNASIERGLITVDAEFDGRIIVDGTSLGMLADDVEQWSKGWSGVGLTYDDFGSEASVDVMHRLAWLACQDGPFRPSPYTQLAAVYSRRGDPEAARQVLIAREQRRTAQLTVRHQMLRRVWAAVSAYGYRPQRAVVALLLLVALSGLAFAHAPMTELGIDQPVIFNPLLYAADLAIPFVDLRQSADYQPTTVWAQSCMWVTIAVGWFLSGAFVAAITGLFTPDE